MTVVATVAFLSLLERLPLAGPRGWSRLVRLGVTFLCCGLTVVGIVLLGRLSLSSPQHWGTLKEHDIPEWRSLGCYQGDSAYRDALTGFATTQWTPGGAGYEVRVLQYRDDAPPVMRLFLDTPSGKAWAEAQLA